MNLSKIFRTRSLALIVLVLLATMVIYGFAAANSVPESGAGDGSGTVSGYTVTNIEYTLLASDPGKLESVEFDVAPTAGASDASEVHITVDSGTTWVSCTNVLTHWTCTFAGGSEPDVLPIVELRVVAVD